MSVQDDRQRTRRERINRLRKRLDEITHQYPTGAPPRFAGILKGILDLLEDEL